MYALSMTGGRLGGKKAKKAMPPESWREIAKLIRFAITRSLRIEAR